MPISMLVKKEQKYSLFILLVMVELLHIPKICVKDYIIYISQCMRPERCKVHHDKRHYDSKDFFQLMLNEFVFIVFDSLKQYLIKFKCKILNFFDCKSIFCATHSTEVQDQKKNECYHTQSTTKSPARCRFPIVNIYNLFMGSNIH